VTKQESINQIAINIIRRGVDGWNQTQKAWEESMVGLKQSLKEQGLEFPQVLEDYHDYIYEMVSKLNMFYGDIEAKYKN